LLLANHAAVNATTTNGRSPLKETAFTIMLHESGLLSTNGPGINFTTPDDKLTPLHLAAAEGNKDLTEILLTSKADVNALDGNGWTPLHLAAIGGYNDIVELLRQHGGHE
jgi:ankyrin repeat protein